MRGAPPSWWAQRCCFQFTCGRDEEDYIEALETVRATLTEEKKAGAADFFIGGDIKLKLGSAGEDLHGLDSIEWYDLYGPECKGGGEDVTTYEKKIRWLQLLNEFNCTAKSTWTNNDCNREYHTLRSWVCTNQLDYIMVPKDIRSTTWHLNKVRLRTWDHFKIEGRT